MHKGGAAAPIGRWSRPGRWWFVIDGTPGPIAGGVAEAYPRVRQMSGPTPRRPLGQPRVRQMSSHGTVGGLPALPEPVRTQNDDTLTHDHA